MKKRLFAAVLAGSMAAGAFGCMAEASEDYTGKVLRVGWWGNDIRNEQTMDILDKFKEQYPGLEVEVEYAGYQDYFTRLNTEAAGGEMPDVIQMDVGKYYMFANNSQLLDLTSYIEDGSIDMSNVSEAELDSTKVCGGTYAVATGMNGLCLLYNPAVLEEAGCTMPEQPTMSEFLEIAQTVYDKTGSRVRQTIGNQEVFFRSLGGSLYADGEDALGFTEEMMLLWCETEWGAIDKELLTTPNNQIESDGPAMMATGEVWCTFLSSNQVASEIESSGVDLEIAASPIADDATVENPTYMKPAMMWSVAADTEMAELAAAFINYFVNDTYVYDVCGADRGVPISSEIRAYLESNLSEADQKSYAYLDWLTEHSTPMQLYTPAKASEAMVPFNDLGEKITYQAVTLEELPELVHEAYEKAATMIAE